MQQPAPKGPNEIAQGEALGKRHPPDSRPERAAWRTRTLDPPRLPLEPQPISPFQGSSMYVAVTQGFALGYLMWPFQGQVPT